MQTKNFKQIKITGQCESPPERRNFNLNDLSNEQFTCSIMTTSQCTYLTKTIIDTTTMPKGWTNFYRSDDVSALSYFYLDKPVCNLPVLQPVAVRASNLRAK